MTDTDTRANARLFSRMVALSEQRAAEARWDSAMAWGRTAAGFAVTNPIGRLRAVELERAMDHIAASALGTAGAAPASGGTASEGRRVLHVLSEAAAIGGLTRLATRWISWDETSTSSVAVTRQESVLPALAESAERSGGQAVVLDEPSPLARARRLRTLARGFDLIVCHLQLDDPIPAVAFGTGYHGAPVLFYNHPDHQFWLAPSNVTIVDFRPIGSALTREVRGYPAGSALALPIPVDIDQTGAASARAETREAFGVREDQTLVVSVARGVKFQDTGFEPRFADIVSEALRAEPALVFCAVGPQPDEAPWNELRDLYPGRILVPGPTPQPRTYLEAADVYLDTFPFSSLTSLLEASAIRLPVLTLDAHSGLSRALGIADFVATPADRPTSTKELVNRLVALHTDDEARAEGGEQAYALFRSRHTRAAWLERLEALYRRVAQALPAHRGHQPSRSEQELLAYAGTLRAVEQRVPLLWTINAGLETFDPKDARSLRARRLAGRAALKIPVTASRWRGVADAVFLPAAGAVRQPARAGTDS